MRKVVGTPKMRTYWRQRKKRKISMKPKFTLYHLPYLEKSSMSGNAWNDTMLLSEEMVSVLCINRNFNPCTVKVLMEGKPGETLQTIVQELR